MTMQLEAGDFRQFAFDYDLRRRIIQFLAVCSLGQSIEVEVRCGTVHLAGNFPSATERQWCLDICRRMPGVLQVVA